MRYSVTTCLIILGTLLLAPSLARPAALFVNGTCEIGSCTSVDSIMFGQSVSMPFAFNYRVGSDAYQIGGNFSSGYDNNGTNIALNLSAIYLGTSPTTTTDTLNVHLLQNIFDSSPGTWDGTYNEHIPAYIGSTTGAGSSLTGQLSFNNQSIGVIGPLGVGTYDITQTANLTGLDANTLSADYNIVMTFAAGTLPGAIINSVPEPAETIAVALGLLLIGLGVLRRRQYSSTRKLS